MRRTFLLTILALFLISNLAFGAPTVFFKDGGKETGTSVWTREDKVYLSKEKVVYEYLADEVLLEQTQKFNRIDGFATPATTLMGSCCCDVKDKPGDLVEQLMKASNLDRQIDQFIQQFSSGALSASGDNPELNDIFVQALNGFDAQKAKRKIRAYYRSHLDRNTLEALLAWTRTPLGVKIRDAETGMSVTSLEDVQQMLSDFENNPPPAARLALIRDLDKAGQATEMALQLVTEAAAGAISAIPGSSADRKQARKEIDSIIKQQKGIIEPQVRTQVEAALAATYKGLSDNEMREYIAFTRTEPAAKFNKATMGALSEMTRDMSASMIRNIVKAVEKKKEAVQQ
jgi:Uncharacterized protein conserved in bacteria (DUF2059)